MAIISIYIRDQDIERVVDAICTNYKYDISETNPYTKDEFVNQIIRKFIFDNVKLYEVEEAKRIALAGKENIELGIDDGSTAVIHRYCLICLGESKVQYDYIAGLLSPGNSFDIPLGDQSITHFGLEIGITENARQQLLALELSGGTQSGGIQTLFYIRRNEDNIVQSTNIDESLVGMSMTMTDLINYFGYRVIE